MSDTHSRRTVLTALAAATTASVPAFASVAGTSELDPIFALIEAAKRANANLSETAEEKESECVHILLDAEKAVLNAKPRTLAGLVAQFLFAAEYLAELTWLNEDGGPFYSDEGLVLPLLVNAARMVDGALVAKIGLSDRLEKILSFKEQAA